MPKRPLKKPISKPSPKKVPSEKGTGFCGKSPFFMVLYGPSGVGKTAFAANFPNAGFLIDNQEDGIRDLIEFGQAPEPKFIEEVDSWESTIDILESVATGEREISTLVMDSMTGFEKLCFIYHCRENFEDDWSKKGFYNYSQGPKNAAKTDWPKMLDRINDCRLAANVNVILIGHSQVKSFDNPEGDNYDRFIPYLDKETWAQTHRTAKLVLFYNYHTEFQEKKGPKAKANLDQDQRFLYTIRTPAFDAKQRHGLPSLIDAGESGEEAYKNFREAYRKAGK